MLICKVYITCYMKKAICSCIVLKNQTWFYLRLAPWVSLTSPYFILSHLQRVYKKYLAQKMFWLARSQRYTDTIRPTCAAWAGHCDTKQVLFVTASANFLHSGKRFCSVKWLTKTLECSISQGITFTFKTAKIKGINLLPVNFEEITNSS